METRNMASKKILIGVTAILAVAIVVVLAVALTTEGNHSGDDSQNSTIQQACIAGLCTPQVTSKPEPKPDIPQSTSEPPPADVTSTPPQEEPTTQLTPQEEEEYFVRTNNSYHGGLLIKNQDQIQMVVGFALIGENAAGENKTLVLEMLQGANVSRDGITMGEKAFERHEISQEMPDNQKLPKPGLYATRLGDNATTGWFEDGTELENSMGILSFEYNGPIFTGTKLIGDQFVPSGEISTLVNTTDGTAKSLWANRGYVYPNWKPSEFHFDEGVDEIGHFRVTTTVDTKTFYIEFVHLDEMQKVDAEVAVRFAERPDQSLGFGEEGP